MNDENVSLNNIDHAIDVLLECQIYAIQVRIMQGGLPVAVLVLKPATGGKESYKCMGEMLSFSVHLTLIPYRDRRAQVLKKTNIGKGLRSLVVHNLIVRQETLTFDSIYAEDYNMVNTAKIAVLIGSTRPVRIGPQVARFVVDSINAKPGSNKVEDLRASRTVKLDILDLKDYSLPIFDEPIIPNRITSPDGYTHEHTRVWSRTVTSYDAFIFVSAQRNWGIPAELKNCIDFLFNEWRAKPAMIITYGGHGGAQAGEQLNTVLSSIRMRMTDGMINMAFPSAEFREKAFLGEDLELDAPSDTGAWNEHCNRIADIFWTDLMEKLNTSRE